MKEYLAKDLPVSQKANALPILQLLGYSLSKLF
jgi:hypothetical protein